MTEEPLLAAVRSIARFGRERRAGQPTRRALQTESRSRNTKAVRSLNNSNDRLTGCRSLLQKLVSGMALAAFLGNSKKFLRRWNWPPFGWFAASCLLTRPITHSTTFTELIN